MDEKSAAAPTREPPAAAGLLDVLIRAGIILAMAVACYQIFAPFLSLMAWAVILAVTLYPMQQYLAAKMGGRQGLASTLLVVLGFALLIVPTGVLMNSLGDSMEQVVTNIQNHTIEVPPPREAVAKIPARGRQDLSSSGRRLTTIPKALVQSMQPKISDLAKGALAFVASIGGGLLQFLAASPSRGSSWRSARRAPKAAARSSNAWPAMNAAPSSPAWRPPRFARSRRA